MLGSVEKLAGQYQVNARIVEVETGEVLSTAFSEMPAEMFEETAKPFLSPVPERQAIGIYFLYNYRSNPNRFSPYRLADGNGTGITTPESFRMSLAGGGIRYFPLAECMLDFSIAMLSNNPSVASLNYQTGYSAGNADARRLSQIFLGRATLNWVHPLSMGFRSLLGAGIAVYKVFPDNIDFDTIIAPTLRAGIEYKPQARVGLALFANYDFLSRTGTDHRPPHADALQFSRWSIEPTVALYF